MIQLHALVGSGKQEEAMALFAELQHEHGVLAAKMLESPKGPATALAAELAKASAYR